MTTSFDPRAPLILPPEHAAEVLANSDALVIDLSKPEIYAQAHLANAVPFAYSELVLGQPPAPGLLPDIATLSQRLSACGINHDRHVVAYDDEGGGKAARLCWTLHYLGHNQVNVIDGGIHGWMQSELPVTQRPTDPQSVNFVARINDQVLADADYIHERLDHDDMRLLDSRTPAEYNGSDVRSARGGHIPGAINVNWLDTIDRDRGFRMHPADLLRKRLNDAGIHPDKEIVSYCQTHHRSSHAYVMLKNLGYDRVRGYAGSWSEWGNRDDLPIA